MRECALALCAAAPQFLKSKHRRSILEVLKTKSAREERTERTLLCSCWTVLWAQAEAPPGALFTKFKEWRPHLQGVRGLLGRKSTQKIPKGVKTRGALC